MAHKFDKDDKQVKEFSESIPFGVHKVKFTGAIADATEAGKEFVEIGVESEDGIEDSARLWFVGGAVNISFNTIRQIAVHNVSDDKKDKARDAIDDTADTAELAETLNKIMGTGGELWFTKFYDPSRTYQNQSGETKRSVNRNVYGYEPKPRPDLMPDSPKPDTIVDPDSVEDFPIDGATPASKEATDNIPDDWS